MWGLTRSVLQNLVLGVTEGHSAILRLVGVGYRATMEDDGRKLSLKVGFSHPVELPVPEGVRCSVPMPTRILLEGCDKVKVMDFAASIRDWRKPEPYKGKVCILGWTSGHGMGGANDGTGYFHQRRDYQVEGQEGQIDIWASSYGSFGTVFELCRIKKFLVSYST